MVHEIVFLVLLHSALVQVFFASHLAALAAMARRPVLKLKHFGIRRELQSSSGALRGSGEDPGYDVLHMG